MIQSKSKKTKNIYKIKIKIIFLYTAIIVCFFACTPKIKNTIYYDSNYDNTKAIEEGLNLVGVNLNLSNEFTSGKGIMSIKDSENNNEEEIAFIIVEKEILENGEIKIVNEVPTSQGVLEVGLIIKDDKQKSSFRIAADWKTSINFETVFSSVKMNKPIQSKGMTFIEIEYKGKQCNGDRTIELKNVFYVEN